MEHDEPGRLPILISYACFARPQVGTRAPERLRLTVQGRQIWGYSLLKERRADSLCYACCGVPASTGCRCTIGTAPRAAPILRKNDRLTLR